jgi:hypothetical protein
MSNQSSRAPNEVIPQKKAISICEALSFPDDLIYNAKLYFFIEFLKLADNFVDRAAGVDQVIDPTLTISLPFPEDVSQQFNYSFSPADLSFYRMGYDETKEFLDGENGQGLLDRGFLENAKSLLDGIGDSGEYVGRQMLGTANDTAGGLIGRGEGKIPNPNPSLFFQGIPLRTHNFNWLFVPRNETESENLHDMIKKFRDRVSPKKKNNFLTYPQMIDENGNDMSEKYGTKFLKSHVSSFNVNYTPAGTSAFYKNGYPVGVSLSMEIQEIEMYTEDAELASSRFSF